MRSSKTCQAEQRMRTSSSCEGGRVSTSATMLSMVLARVSSVAWFLTAVADERYRQRRVRATAPSSPLHVLTLLCMAMARAATTAC